MPTGGVVGSLARTGILDPDKHKLWAGKEFREKQLAEKRAKEKLSEEAVDVVPTQDEASDAEWSPPNPSRPFGKKLEAYSSMSSEMLFDPLAISEDMTADL